MPILACDIGTIVEAVARIDPAIIAASESVAHSVRVTSRIERTVQHFAFIAFAVAVFVVQKPDVRNAETNDSITIREKSDRNVQLVGKHRHIIRFAIAVPVFQNADGVARRHVSRSRKGIFQRTADPQSAFGVERQIHRFCDVRLRSNQFHAKTIRYDKRCLFVLGAERFRSSNTQCELIFSRWLSVGRCGCSQEADQERDGSCWQTERHPQDSGVEKNAG